MGHRKHPLLATLAVGIALVMTFLVTSTSFAASSDGANTVNYRSCETYSDGSKVCYSYQFVYNTVTPPYQSGVVSYTGIASGSFSQTDASGNIIYASSYSYKGHELTLDGLIQEMGQALTYSYTYNGVTCTFPHVSHEANGQIQFDRSDPSCS